MAEAPQGNEPKEVSREEARKLLDEGAQLVDVRADHEWEAGRIAGSSMAAAALTEAGFDAAKMSEGIVGWAGDEMPLEPEGGYVADSGEAAAILQAQKKPSHS